MSLRSHTLRLAASLPEGEFRSELEKLASNALMEHTFITLTHGDTLILEVEVTIQNWSNTAQVKGMDVGLDPLLSVVGDAGKVLRRGMASLLAYIENVTPVIMDVRSKNSHTSIEREGVVLRLECIGKASFEEGTGYFVEEDEKHEALVKALSDAARTLRADFNY